MGKAHADVGRDQRRKAALPRRPILRLSARIAARSRRGDYAATANRFRPCFFAA
jgi:hypothetical protein